jgi:hypothetical protein
LLWNFPLRTNFPSWCKGWPILITWNLRALTLSNMSNVSEIFAIVLEWQLKLVFWPTN